LAEDLVEGGTDQLGEKIGVFGGTFDPVHNGHCILASQFKQQCGLDSVVVIPAAIPPHKLSSPLAEFEQRYTMLSLAFAGIQNVFISRLEQFRKGPSFTIDTLCELKNAIDGKQQLFFAIGADALAEIHTWKQYRNIPNLACLVVFSRKFGSIPLPEKIAGKAFPDYYFAKDNRSFFAKNEEKIRLLGMPPVDISSSRIKQAIATGEKWQDLVPKAVCAYIVDHHLYK